MLGRVAESELLYRRGCRSRGKARNRVCVCVCVCAAEEADPVQSGTQSPAEEAEEQKMHLVVVCKHHRNEMAMAPSKPLQRLFEAWKRFAEGEGWIAADTDLRFVFDGDPLSGNETPTGERLRGVLRNRCRSQL